MKTIKSKIIFSSFILTMICSTLFSQMNYWMLPDHYVNMNFPPTPTTMTWDPGSTYISANAAFDNNGTLLFYAKAEATGAITIFGPGGSPSITLADLIYTCNGPTQITKAEQEIAIVPVPNTCKKYYVIWVGFAPVQIGEELGYAIVDCSSGVPSVPTNTQQITCVEINSSGIAVTKPDPTGFRYLLVVETHKLTRYTITASGITSPLILADGSNASCFTGLGVAPFELEVSPDGQKVLFSSYIGNNNVFELYFSPDVYASAPTVSQATYTLPAGGYSIEYDANASKLFASTFLGLYWATSNAAGGTMTAIPSSAAYNRTFLEYAKDNNIYASDNSGNLAKIDPVTLSITSAGLPQIHSNGNLFPPGISVYSLPDQIDGENYNTFFTQPAPTSSFTVNGSVVFATTALQVCINNPIIMSTLSSNATQYQLTIYNSNSSGQIGTQVSSTGWLNGAPPSNIPLTFSTTGFYLILLEVKDVCNNISVPYYGLLQVLDVSSAFTIPPGCIAPGQTVNFCANQPNDPGISYSWTFQQGSPSAGNTQCVNNVSWTSTGTYNVTLTVTHTSGCTSTTTQTITISDAQVCCDANSTWTVASYSVPQNTTATWTNSQNPFSTPGPIRIQNDLTIQSGSSIAIDNMTFQFGLNGRVVIEPTATLTLNGTTFNGSLTCLTMWNGVIVEGDMTNNAQSAQGQFFMNDNLGNHSRIINAIYGVANWNYLSGNANTHGGYFNLNDAQLFNCYVGVYAEGQNSNLYQSRIDHCTFLCNGMLLYYPFNGWRTSAGVFAYNSFNNINFAGSSSFTNADNGIVLTDANQFHISYCAFHDVTSGIIYSNTSSTLQSNLDLHNNTFDRFFYGITIRGGMDDDISNNVFNTKYQSNTSDPLGSQLLNFSGIEMNASSGFRIYDNDFYHVRSGIKVSDSGPVGGKIYPGNGGFGNHFYACWRGVQTYNDNSNLDIKCNYFENLQIAADWSTGWFCMGQLKNQGNLGSTQDPAGNEFFHLAGRTDIYSANAPFNYTHHTQPFCLPSHTFNVSTVNSLLAKTATSCTNLPFMETVNNDPDLAKAVIAAETDERIRIQYINDLVRWYQARGMNEEAIAYLEQINNTSVRDILIRLYMRSAAYQEVQNQLNAMSANTDIESMNYVALNTIVLHWAQYALSPFDMTNDEENIIRQVSESYTPSAVQAHSILGLVFNERYVETPVDTGGGRYAYGEYSNGKITEEIGLTLSPNPANDQVLASFKLMTNEDQAEIEMTDMSGRKVFYKFADKGQQEVPIDLTKLSRGSYMVELKINHVLVARNKLLLIKS